jgi:ribosomal-protein-alanine N-acetyltransferase
MITIETERMIIRNFAENDWQELKEVIIDKENSEYALYDHPFPTSENEIKDITNWFSKSDDFLAAYETAEKKVIGYIAINNEDSSEYNLGYCFHSAYQDKGYASEACVAVINHVFRVLKATKFTTGTAVLNVPSCKLLTKLGFRKTGESLTSLRKDEEGRPIEFIGASFELSRDAWLKSHYMKCQSTL